MANSYLKSSITQGLLLLYYYVATVAADPAARPELPLKTSQHSVSYTAQPHGFPNERLYREYLVIQRFKSTITSDPKNITATWTGHDICGQTTYLGFFCATPTGQAEDLILAGIIWNGYGLRAPKLQGFIDQIPDLAFFHSASNYFGGGVPRVGTLSYSYNLDVDKDSPLHPAGYISSDTTARGGCINGNIHLRINVTMNPMKGWGWGRGRGRGMIPAGATNARALLLNYNSLSGPLPSDLGSSKLSYLALANNKLTGPIPASISQWQDSILEVLLLNNQLSGCLPHELGMLNKATVIDAGMNQLTGPIPSSFSCLTSVEQLNLGGNRLYGEIPDALCKLAAGPAGRLANLTLSSNYFTSVGPACLPLIKDGVLNVKNNCIPGFANQRRPADCASFLSQPKTCPAASATHATCPAAPVNAAAATADRVAKDYSSYVTYATLHK